MGFACRLFLAPTLSCYSAFMSACSPGSAHQPYGPHGRLEHGASLTEIERAMSARSVVMSLMQVPLGMGDNAALVALTTQR